MKYIKRFVNRLSATGTKSLLFGAHCFFIHPIFVAIAWTKLFGFPFDPRLWVAFLVHDWGYWGKPRLDDEDGETHPELGAAIMYKLFDRRGSDHWKNFVLYHSRFYASRHGTQPSPLCWADKYALCLTPTFLCVWLSRLSGEMKEYKEVHAAQNNKYGHCGIEYSDNDYTLFDNFKKGNLNLIKEQCLKNEAINAAT